jgi:predicted DCC family thiol-disulfide oxidoreductase YuxK
VYIEIKVANYLMAYDADCGPCTQFKRLVNFLDIYHAIDFIHLADADKLGLLNTISEPLRFKSFHLISPDGDIHSGSEALYDLIALFPLGGHLSKLIVLLPGGKRVIRFLYNTFSKLHDSSVCHLDYNMRHTHEP